jgi:hypothetical protein
VLLASVPAWADTYTVNGTGAILNIDSTRGEWDTYPADISYPTYNIYSFFEADGIDYRVLLRTGYEASSIYLYHGDGTGEFIQPNISYNHVTGLHTNLKPAVIVVYTDNTVEELVAPECWEGGFHGELTSLQTYPSSFTPPTTGVQAIDAALADNGHNTIPKYKSPVVDEVVATLKNGTQVVWVKFRDNTRALYFLNTNGFVEPLDGVDGKPYCYCSGDSCVEFSSVPTDGTQCAAGHFEDDYDDENKKKLCCYTDDPACD